MDANIELSFLLERAAPVCSVLLFQHIKSNLKSFKWRRYLIMYEQRPVNSSLDIFSILKEAMCK